MSRATFPRVAALKTVEAFGAHLAASGIDLPYDTTLAAPDASPLAHAITIDGLHAGNRFAILPMEGWDGTHEGAPSDLTRRRWRHFGQSGAKLIWGGEAVAVRHDGRASPNQLCLSPATQGAIAALRDELVAEHRREYGANRDSDLVIGLQLTHSGRFAKPDASDRPAPLVACHHPVLDRRVSSVHLLSDDELDRLVDDFVRAARLAEAAGFQFVDVKQCHGYLGHELLGARTRPGRYGGSLDNRTRFLRTVIEAIQSAVPRLRIGVRLSVFDAWPYRKDAEGVGVREPLDPNVTPNGFGLLDVTAGAETDEALDTALEETRAVIAQVAALGVRAVCVTAGSPYYTPHLVRPAFFPPMDGYQPPEDPLRGVARQIRATARLKAGFPHMTFVASGYSYLQEWLPYVAQRTVGTKMTDIVGLGRMVLSYPAFARDVLRGTPLRRGSICRTFSDCTTGPRLGLVSGCYPLDAEYARTPDARTIQEVRTKMNVAG